MNTYEKQQHWIHLLNLWDTCIKKKYMNFIIERLSRKEANDFCLLIRDYYKQ
jgi:hypothetical protein